MASRSNKWRIALALSLAVWFSATLTAGGQQPAPGQAELQQLKADLQKIEERIEAIEKTEQDKTEQDKAQQDKAQQSGHDSRSGFTRAGR